MKAILQTKKIVILCILLALLIAAVPLAKAETPYVSVTSWGTYGLGQGEFAYPFGIAVDNNGNVYVADGDNHRIEIFDNNGNYLTQWGDYGWGNGKLGYPAGIAVDSNGYVYVTDQSNFLQKFDSQGNFQLQWGGGSGPRGGGGDGEFSGPQGIAIDSVGNIYVADTRNHRIQKFDSNGNFLAKWGTWGQGPSEFFFPEWVTVGANDNIYVADTNNHRIQKFDNNGNFLTEWGGRGGDIGQFNYAEGIAADAAGNIYVSDLENFRIQKFDGNGAFLAQWGSSGSGLGQFGYVFGLAVDKTGTVFTTDTQNNNVQKFVFAVPDNVAPTITSANDGQTYILGQTVSASWAASDSGSGVATSSATVTTLNTATVGTKTFTVTATDKAGNTAFKTVTYTVIYSTTFGHKILAPIQQVNAPNELAKAQKAGSNLPIKFQLCNNAGTPVTSTTMPKLAVTHLSVNGEVEVNVDASGKSNEGNTFRYDSTAMQYIFNLNTKGFVLGSYRITVSLDDGSTIVTYFKLDK